MTALTAEKERGKLDPAVEAFRQARAKPAVLKLDLAKLRTSAPSLPILAFEGDDDKIVYRQWIRRVDERKRYLCFPCGGKGNALSLRASLNSDRTGLAEGVYFFVDRDFDDLRGQPFGDDIFMTDRYSVENYFVEEALIDDILQIEFHCHSSHEIRAEVLALFKKTYDIFLDKTREHNYRIFYSRKKNIEMKPLPSSIRKIANISIDNVTDGTLSAAQAVSYVDESKEITDEFEFEFNLLDKRKRFRGKFALEFLFSWLHQLADEIRKPDKGIFSGVNNKSKIRLSEITLNMLASRSHIPDHLRKFIDTIKPITAA